VGDSRDLGEGEVLHLGHPVVQGAIEDARRETANPLRVVFGPPDTSPTDALRQLAGRCGRLVVTKAAYRGLESVDHLLATAVIEGHTDPLPASVVDVLLTLPVRSSQLVDSPDDSALLQDAIDDALFDDQAAVSSQEQARFEQMLRQLDHYLSDQILVRRRKRAAVDEQIENAEQRRDKARDTQVVAETGSRLGRLLSDRAEIDRQIDRLENGGDDEYQAWRGRLFARRFSTPAVVRILDVQFEVAAGDV
jgi:hypothetical protein